MQRRIVLAPLCAACLALAVNVPARGAEEDLQSDKALLQQAGLPADGAGLLAFFKTRARGEVSSEEIAALVEKLGDKSAAVRHKACTELIAVGAPAIPALRQAAKDPDLPEVATLSRRCLKALEHEPGALTAAALHVLAARRPAGTAEVLLQVLPEAEDESVLQEVKSALAAVAYAGGKPDPALLKALEDGEPLRRAAAIVALSQEGNAVPQAALRKLLKDPKPTVRLQAALALARASDPKAVSTLISLLGDLPPSRAQEAEEFLTHLAGEQAPKAPLGTDEVSRQKCRDAWAEWWLASEGSKLIEEVTKRTLTEFDRAKVEKLIKQLGDEEFDVREKATNELKAMGVRALPLLRQAAKDADLEVRTRSAAVLDAIEKDKATPLSIVTPRLIALRKPAGAAAALLGFMPFAEDEDMVNAVQAALNAVAFKDGKPDPAVVKALADKSAARRGAAAEALAQGAPEAHRDALRKLLKDENPAVRLKTALALAGARDREAVPVLITLVGELPAEQGEHAEEYLRRLAAGKAPKLPEGDSAEARKKRRDAWASWWDANGAKVQLVARHGPQTAEPYHGYTLLVANGNQIVELGADGKQRWAINGLLNPWDAQVLPGNRVLVAEYNGQRVTERNLKGDVLWKYQVNNWPMAAERLSNGHTFIVCRNQLIEVDRGGKVVSTITRNDGIMSARKMRDGQIVLINNFRQCLRLDRAGKELKRYQMQMIANNFNEILPNGHVLVPVQWQNKVQEYDADGKVVAEITAVQPHCAYRLPNGRTLVGVQQWPQKVLEFDKKGKQVAEMSTNNIYPLRIKRR